MFMWNVSRATPQSPPTASASASACSQRFRKYVSNRLSGSSPIRTPTVSACAWHSRSASTHQRHSSAGEPIGVILPTVDGTTVTIWPPSSDTNVRQSLTYSTLPSRM